MFGKPSLFSEVGGDSFALAGQASSELDTEPERDKALTLVL